MFDILMVGGGASGMMAAIQAALFPGQKPPFFKIGILEKTEKLGKKILATGNGKCNYTNQELLLSGYHSADLTLVSSVLQSYSVEESIAFFMTLGIYPKEKNGWLYPYSEQASAVVDAMKMELRRLSVEIFLETKVCGIRKEKKGFSLQTEAGISYKTKQVIFSGGGCASKQLGSDGSILTLMESMGHTIIPPVPALVQLKCKGKFLKILAGLRMEAKASLYISNEEKAKEEGELLFTDYGLSGILILQLSYLASRALFLGKQVGVLLDLLPKIEEKELVSLILERLAFGKHKTVEEIFIGLLPSKLTFILLKEIAMEPDACSAYLDVVFAKRFAKIVKGFSLPVTDTKGFDFAQVMAGGVSTKEVDQKTLESKKQKGIYLTGELLDVDGTCGGYNLQWAFSSGAVAGRAAARQSIY